MDLVAFPFFSLFFTPSFPFLLFSSSFLLPSPLPFFFLLFFLLIYPQPASNSHSSSYLWISCPPAIPLHHGDLFTFPYRLPLTVPYRFFFFFFFLLIYPQLASNSHSSSYLWISCPPAIPLHHGDLFTFPRRWIIFKFTYQLTLLKFDEIYIWITSITKTPHLLDHPRRPRGS